MRTLSLQSAFTVEARTSTSGASDGGSHVSARPYDNGNCSTISVCHSCSCNMTSIILAIRGFAGGVRLKCWHVQVLDVTPEPVQNTGRLMQLIASLQGDDRLPRQGRPVVSAGSPIDQPAYQRLQQRQGCRRSQWHSVLWLKQIASNRAETSRWCPNILS